MKKHILSILVNNSAGVLSRVAGLFSRRGYNIDSLSVGTTEEEEISRITVVIQCDEEGAFQIKNQLRKLIDVLDITELLSEKSVYREIALVKVCSNEKKMLSITNIVNIFRASIIDVSKGSVIIEATGDSGKITALIDALKPYGIMEVVRTGLTGLVRGQKVSLKEELKWQNYFIRKNVI